MSNEGALALYVARSQNDKIGLAAATYASIRHSCPASCPLRGNGCYAETGRVLPIVRRIEGNRRASRLDVARAEAAAIDQGAIYPRMPLRLHVSGDTVGAAAASLVAGAARRYKRRGGGQPWAYTHGWRETPRGAWRGVSVLASVDSTQDGRAALRKGYAPAVVVARFPSDRAFEADGVTWVPCPFQTRGVRCSSCGLCLDANGLRDRKHGIAFEPEGQRKRRLRVLLESEHA